MYAYIRKGYIYSQCGPSGMKVQDKIHYHKHLFQNILESLFSECKTAIKQPLPKQFPLCFIESGNIWFCLFGILKEQLMSPEVIEAVEFILK